MGSSAIGWANLSLSINNKKLKVFCIDTWLGSAEHYLDLYGHEWSRDQLNIKNSQPNFYDNFLSNIDNLLWRWKSPLSREWYPYLLNLKHDLQILNNELTFNRILKTQTNPLQIKLNRGDN